MIQLFSLFLCFCTDRPYIRSLLSSIPEETMPMESFKKKIAFNGSEDRYVIRAPGMITSSLLHCTVNNAIKLNVIKNFNMFSKLTDKH